MFTFILLAVATAIPSLPAAELPVQTLTKKAFNRAMDQVYVPAPTDHARVCAIPLKEVKAGLGWRMDPIYIPAKSPARSASIDPMARAAVIQACSAK